MLKLDTAEKEEADFPVLLHCNPASGPCVKSLSSDGPALQTISDGPALQTISDGPALQTNYL